MTRRVLVVGESPSCLSGTAFSPGTSSGDRLDVLFRRRPFDGVNLLARTLLSGEPWPTELARERARALYEDCFAGREVVLFGRRVARSFSGLSPWTDALALASYFSLACPTVRGPRRSWCRCMVWLAPHPSGRSRWWNRLENRRQADLFFGRVFGELPFPADQALPSLIPPEDWTALGE